MQIQTKKLKGMYEQAQIARLSIIIHAFPDGVYV